MKKKKNPLVMLLALLGLGALALVTFSCLAGLIFSRSTATPAVSHLPKLTPTAAVAARTGEAKKDLGVVSGSPGSANQAVEMLKLIEAQPNKSDYQLSYSTKDDTVLFGCNFEKNVIVRIHQRPDGTGSQESWQGYVLERLKAAAGGGSLNDTPEGKIEGSFEEF